MLVADVLNRCGAGFDHPLAILGVNDVDPEVRFIEPSLDGIAKQALGLLTHVRKLHRLRVGFPDDGVEIVEELSTIH